MDKTGRLIYLRKEESVKSISREKTDEGEEEDEGEDAGDSYYDSSYYDTEYDRDENV